MRYAGIGSRDTPEAVCVAFNLVAQLLANKGAVLYSGHAEGADISFESGCNQCNGEKKIFLPWKGFNGSESDYYNSSYEAFRVAERYHPAWNRLSGAGKKLMARNSYQVLDGSLDNPVDLVVCWTEGGLGEGGTGQALRIATDYEIPVIDFGSFNTIEEALRKLEDVLKEKGLVDL